MYMFGFLIDIIKGCFQRNANKAAVNSNSTANNSGNVGNINVDKLNQQHVVRLMGGNLNPDLRGSGVCFTQEEVLQKQYAKNVQKSIASDENYIHM